MGRDSLLVELVLPLEGALQVAHAQIAQAQL